MKMKAIVILASIILMITVVQVFQLNSIREKITGLAASGSGATGTGQIDMTGWTANEKMNYEMHGTIPARVNAGGGSGGTGMVGGC